MGVVVRRRVEKKETKTAERKENQKKEERQAKVKVQTTGRYFRSAFESSCEKSLPRLGYLTFAVSQALSTAQCVIQGGRGHKLGVWMIPSFQKEKTSRRQGGTMHTITQTHTHTLTVQSSNSELLKFFKANLLLWWLQVKRQCRGILAEILVNNLGLAPDIRLQQGRGREREERGEREEMRERRKH